MNQRTIFLDLDGVLVTTKAHYGKLFLNNGVLLEREFIDTWDDYCVGLLKRILQLSGAQIVISSTWRTDDNKAKLFLRLEHYGLKQYLHPHWRTMVYDEEYPMRLNVAAKRGKEVEHWLATHDIPFKSENYLIIDDLPDFYEYQIFKLIQTEEEHGLSWSDYKHICARWKLDPYANPQ